MALSPSAEQYFVFSRVDGRLSVAELCNISGLGRQKTLEALEFLARAGAIELAGYASPSVSPSAPADATLPGQNNATRAQDEEPALDDDAGGDGAEVVPNYPIPPEAFDFDPALLAQDAALDDTLRRELICLCAQLGQMSYYDFFGLQPTADRKEIKTAYFRLSKRFHPDRFFRQELGALRPMQEQVFKELTRAYKTLSKKSSRQAYDEALQAHRAQQAGGEATREATSEEDAERQELHKRQAVGALLMRRAEKLMARGDFEGAAGEYRKALALTRDPHVAMTVASQLLDEAQMPEEAMSFAHAALKLGVAAASAHFLLGRALEAQGAAAAALKAYQKVLDAVPDHAEARARVDALQQDM